MQTLTTNKPLFVYFFFKYLRYKVQRNKELKTKDRKQESGVARSLVLLQDKRVN